MTVQSALSNTSIVGWDRPPVVLIASGEAARTRAQSSIEQAGWRTAVISEANAGERLDLQASASALWVELDDVSPAWDCLLGDAGFLTSFPTIVAAPMALLDPVAAAIGDRPVELLIDPNEVERATSLAVATARKDADASVHDVSTEPSAARLRQLSDEVGRIAATLARLSTGPAGVTVELPNERLVEGEATITGEQVRAVIRARRLRARFFDAEMFADPAWDMLLDLFQAEIAQHRVPVSSLCIAAAVPPTTALRWIKTMTDNGLFRRRADPHDGRRVFVELAPDASSAMRRYFAQIGAVTA